MIFGVGTCPQVLVGGKSDNGRDHGATMINAAMSM